MTVYYPTFEPVVNPLIMVTQVRELPLAGELLKRVGNRVEPDEVLGRTLVPARGQRFPVARLLGIPEKNLSRFVLAKDGDSVAVNDLVVRVGGLRQRLWRAPVAGTLSTGEAERGYLVITPPSQTFELRAPFKGFISAVEPYRSVTIQTPAALVQGAFGFGGERHGVLRAAVTAPGDELPPEALDERAALSIVVGGSTVSAAALRRAVELRVRGLIVGSITEQDLRAFLGCKEDGDWGVGANGWAFPPLPVDRNFPLTLMVTEGVGRWPMDEPAFELLTSYDGAEAALDGRTWLHGPQMRRPQLLIPLLRAEPSEISVEAESEQLALGAEVRLLNDSLLGQTGTIVGFSRGLRGACCGARYRMVEVRLADGRTIAVPQENLEALGKRKR